jgi:hypothetical protein
VGLSKNGEKYQKLKLAATIILPSLKLFLYGWLNCPNAWVKLVMKKEF